MKNMWINKKSYIKESLSVGQIITYMKWRPITIMQNNEAEVDWDPQQTSAQITNINGVFIQCSDEYGETVELLPSQVLDMNKHWY